MSLDDIHQLSAFDQPWTKHGMLQIGGGFLHGRNPEKVGLRGPSKPLELGKDKPHPVPKLVALSEFCDNAGEDVLLRIDKSLQIVGIVHDLRTPRSCPNKQVTPRRLISEYVNQA